jgi:hypothetical protein
MLPPSGAPNVRHLSVWVVRSLSQNFRSCSRRSAKLTMSVLRLRTSFSTFRGLFSSSTQSLKRSISDVAASIAGLAALVATASLASRIGPMTASGAAFATRSIALRAPTPVRSSAVATQLGRPRRLFRHCQCPLSLVHTCASYSLMGDASVADTPESVIIKIPPCSVAVSMMDPAADMSVQAAHVRCSNRGSQAFGRSQWLWSVVNSCSPGRARIPFTQMLSF